MSASRRAALAVMAPRRKPARRAAAAPRKRKALRSKAVVPRGITSSTAIGFPDVMQIRMRYIDTQQFTFAGASAMKSDDWYANGLWDPYVAAGGHQPMGYKQAYAYYQFAFVESSTCTVTMSADTAALTEPLRVGVFCFANTTSPYTDWRTMQESGVKTTSLSGTPDKGVVCKASFNNKAMFGMLATNNVADFANSASANALRTATYRVWVQPEQVAVITANVGIVVQIDYVVTLMTRNALPAS